MEEQARELRELMESFRKEERTKEVAKIVQEYFMNKSDGDVVAEFGYGDMGTYIYLSDLEHRRTFYFEDADFREWDDEKDDVGDYDEDRVLECCEYAWVRFSGLFKPEDIKRMNLRIFYED